MEPIVIYEDEWLLIVDKPSGWIVNEAGTTGDNPVVQTWVRERYNFEIAKDLEYRSGIVHRLDKETSGILVLAKKKDVFTRMQAQFKEREIEKSYWALSHGYLDLKEGIIDAPLGRLPWNRERFGVLPGGRRAQTGYEEKDKFENPDTKEGYTLLELYPKTGRTHQIRVHLKHIGHAIVADTFYAGRKTARRDRQWCPRLFLHAARIKFVHPHSLERVAFNSDLPNDLKTALSHLEKKVLTN